MSRRSKHSSFLPRFAFAACMAFTMAFFSGCGGGGSEPYSKVAGPVIPSPPKDSTPPAAPSPISATQDKCVINVSWTNPTDEDFKGVVVRRGAAAYPYDPVATDSATDKIVCSSATSSCAESGLADNARYYYSVFAYDSSGNYSPAAKASVVCLVPPSSPTDMTATHDHCMISLSWNNPSDADIAGVVVRRGDASFPTDPTAANSPANQTVCSGNHDICSEAGLTIGATYYYSVFAYDSSGLYSEPATASTICNNAPGAPTNFKVSQNDCVMSLSWKSPNDYDLSGVRVRRGKTGYPTNPSLASTKDDYILCDNAFETCYDTELDDGVEYYYSAFTYNDKKNYSEAAKVSAKCVYDSFRIAVIPDSQYYSLDYPELFKTMTTWIRDYRDKRKFAFVLHEGDIVHTNTEAEWRNAEAAMTILDGNLPYVLAVGNHDYSGDRNTSKFNSHFPLSRYSSLPTFGGAFEANKTDNTYHLFTAGGADWLVVSLEYDARDAAVAWANGIISSYPNRRVIILTHSYLDVDGKLGGYGKTLWKNLVKLHSNITFVFNGHYLGNTAGTLVSVGDNGNMVYQMEANYQEMSMGGLGYFRIIKLNPIGNKVTVKTYSPFQNKYKTDSQNQFVFENVGLASPR